jgi:PAS domain S-box-containing protein
MENGLGNLIDALPVLAWTALPDGQIDFFNRRWCEYTGFSVDQSCGSKWQAAVHSNDLPELLKRWPLILNSVEPLEVEARLRHFDGEFRWFLFRANPLAEAGGRVVKWCGIFTDIDVRKRSEEQRSQHWWLSPEGKGDHFRSIVDGLPAFVTLLRPNGKLALANRQVLEFLGATLDDIKGWEAACTFHPDDRPGVLAAWQGSAETGEPCGRISGWNFLIADIDDRKRAEQALQASEINLRKILDRIPGLVCTINPVGQIELANQPLMEYFGMTVEELNAWGTNGAVHPDDLPSVIVEFTHSMATGTPYDSRLRYRRADGVYRWFQIRILPVRDSEGRITRWYCLISDIEDRKRTEEALQSSERNLRRIVDSIPGLVCTMSPAGALEHFNQQVLDYFGRTREELRDWAFNDSVHPDDLPHVIEAFTKSIATGTLYDVEHRCRRADGVYRWFQVRALPVRETDDRITGWYVLLIDIDDRKRAEDAVRTSERNLYQIINTIPAFAWSARPDGTAEFFNQHYLRYLGLSQEQAQDWGWTEAIHPDDLNGMIGAWQLMMKAEKGGECEARLRRFDGQYRWFLFRTNPLRDESGDIVKWYGTNVDIEDRRRSEEALRESEQRFRLIVDGIAGLVAIMSPTGEVEDVNRQVLTYFGKAVEQLKGWPSSNAVHPDDLPAVVSAWTRSVETASAYDIDHRLLRADGEYRWFHARGLPLCDAEGRVLRWYVLLTDINDQKQAEEALTRARAELANVARVTSLGVLTASIAHEVNQPLSGIVMNASTCLRMLDTDPANIEGARETARRTIRDGNRASEVVTRLRALFKRKEVAAESIDLNDAAREVIALSLSELRSNKIMVRHEFAENLPPVKGDRIQLQQVILNLLRNASDAMRDIDNRPRQLLIKTDSDDSKNVQLTVQDTGIGFAPDTADRLFESFYTTKDDGTGIGLSVSRSIIEAHRGRLWASANEGPGSSFAFSIPQDYSTEST